ncbi:MAG: glutamyl-tRNA reductase [Frankiales bacterium]|nr:glutamyl-tRNA reductase [Frankiales bacterium]
MVNAMTIVSVSVSHRSAPVEVLQRLAVSSAELPDVLARLHALPAIHEVAVLSTCNRVEIYVAAPGSVAAAARAAAGVLAARGRLEVGEVMRMAGIRVGDAAAEHLFSVACGLESMAVGEEQIVAQIKAAVRAAAAAGTAGPAILGLIDAALRVSKRVRTETTISTAGISLARAGIDLATAHFGSLAGRHAVVFGTGSMGKLAARLLGEAGVGQLTIAGRNPEHVFEVGAAVGGTPARDDDVPAALARADVLICATGAAEPVVRVEQLQLVGGRALFVLDLGLPPNVDPAVARLAGVTLVDLDALGRHLAGRAVPDQVPQVRAIVAEARLAYLKQHEQAGAGPVIAAMYAQIRQLADAELERLHYRLPGLNEEQRRETTATVHRTVRKVLHGLTVLAKELATDPNAAVHLEALRELFDLSPGAGITQSAHPYQAEGIR